MIDFGPSFGGALGFSTRGVALALEEALGRFGIEARQVIVLGDDLARALGRTRLPIVSVSPAPRRRRKGPPQVAARIEQLPFADGAADAVFSVGLPALQASALAALARLVRDGGLLAVATSGPALGRRVAPPDVIAAALLHAALADIEQLTVGNQLISLGRVRKWTAAPRPG